MSLHYQTCTFYLSFYSFCVFYIFSNVSLILFPLCIFILYIVYVVCCCWLAYGYPKNIWLYNNKDNKNLVSYRILCALWTFVTSAPACERNSFPGCVNAKVYLVQLNWYFIILIRGRQSDIPCLVH